MCLEYCPLEGRCCGGTDFLGHLSHDDKATFGREQAFVIAKREVNSPSPQIFCGSMTDTM